MENFKGTPGPWQVVDTYGNYEPYSPENPQLIVWNGDEQTFAPVCDMGELGDMNYAVALADAQLISASPDLLECLQKLIEAHKKDDTKSYGFWVEAGDRAIRKALGL